MTSSSQPVLRTGKICYIEIPTTDIRHSAEFYAHVFGWSLRQRGDGSTAFDDSVGQVSGSWVLGRPPSTEPGIMIHIMVGDAARTVDAVLAAGGEIVQPVHTDGREVLARFRDPGGNVLGIYQQPGLAESEASLATS